VQEPTTQLQLGVRQSFPPGDARRLEAKRVTQLGRALREEGNDRTRRVRRGVRESWLETYYWMRAGKVVADSKGLFRSLVGVTQGLYAAGRNNQQDVLRAELELGRLDDRATGIAQRLAAARAELARWVGEPAAARPLVDKVPDWPAPPPLGELEQALPQHPLLLAAAARVRAAQHGVGLARQQYKPAWMLDLTYGLRAGHNADGGARSDMLSAMVVVDLPLFPDKRQDRRLADRQLRAQGAGYAREDRLRELRRELESQYAAWLRLGERERRFRERLVPQAEQNARVSLTSYQSDAADFSAVMRARITALDTRLDGLRVQVDRLKARAALWYLGGEAS